MALGDASAHLRLEVPPTREDLPGDNGGTFAFDGLEAAARRARDAAASQPMKPDPTTTADRAAAAAPRNSLA